MPLVPRRPARASSRARMTTSVAVVSEVVSERITSISASRRSRAEIGVEEVAVLGVRRLEVAVEHRVAEQ